MNNYKYCNNCHWFGHVECEPDYTQPPGKWSPERTDAVCCRGPELVSLATRPLFDPRKIKSIRPCKEWEHVDA